MASSILRNSAVPSRATNKVSGLSYLLAADTLAAIIAAIISSLFLMSSIFQYFNFSIFQFSYHLVHFLQSLDFLQVIYDDLDILTVVYT